MAKKNAINNEQQRQAESLAVEQTEGITTHPKWGNEDICDYMVGFMWRVMRQQRQRWRVSIVSGASRASVVSQASGIKKTRRINHGHGRLR